ncbi:hypothetical protein LSH36_3100g00014, partial [Paralvinella palmiformis]
MVSSVYQSLLKPDINMFTTSNIVLDTILSEGNFFQTWKGKLIQNKSAPLQIVIKKTKGKLPFGDVSDDEAKQKVLT